MASTKLAAHKLEDIIRRDPEIMGGVPVFVGTRVPVDSLIAHLRRDVSLTAFLDDFPSVTRWQAEAFLELAQEALLVRDDAYIAR
ncbi:MAG: hypothetical protein ACI8V2_004811 [Candidatus Latescibacterota bacterium]|jgi:uncharacterized protein (DUF433 family)